MEMMYNIGMKLFVWAALKEHELYLALFFCVFTLWTAGVNAIQTVFSNSSYGSTAKSEPGHIFKAGILLVRV
jgi:hypothetical protein